MIDKYAGAENTIVYQATAQSKYKKSKVVNLFFLRIIYFDSYLKSIYHAMFTCQFENIDLYPFDIEICNVVIVYGGSSPNLVDIQPSRWLEKSIDNK